MTKRLLYSALIVCLFSTLSIAQQDIRLGTWQLTIDSPRGVIVDIFYIEKTETGYIAKFQDEQFPITITNDGISWDYSLLTANGKSEYRATGVKQSMSKYTGTSDPLPGNIGASRSWTLESFWDEE